MPKLTRIQRKGKKLYRVVLDTEKTSTNYIEITTNAIWNEQTCKHHCIKCYDRAIEWDKWTTTNTAKNTCICGEKATLSIINLDNRCANEL